MSQPAGPYADYLAALRELDGVRASQHDADAARRDRVEGSTASIDAMRQRLATQRERLSTLANQCGLPRPPTQSNPVPIPDDPAAALSAAEADVAQADSGYQDAWYLAHRPKLLPRWRADDRNGVIYGGFALLALAAQTVTLILTAGTERITDALPQILLVYFGYPLLAFAAGWLCVGLVSQPVLGEGTLGPNGKLVRNPRLGMAICASTIVVACWLGNVYLN
ncbi:MAG TPA: hypothetical protein VE172_20435 [Stackebrandtia sp.]|uniref:hypothetical protein n=1 Tax=Stackebrandtia sp. TaxID=2023065 RepID=UPI002D6187ED|nr:hypothetical protein [Stackebrandtia sp.]HZE41174.1 hypothetical protein [Stackebrandtia sp.]